MEVKWESNSRAKALVRHGTIQLTDIIPRTTTDKFPTETATVRMHKVKDTVPYVVVHIRGKSKQRAYWNGGGTYECAHTCRVNVTNGWGNCMSSNGELDEDYDWQDVHKIVEQVKGALA